MTARAPAMPFGARVLAGGFRTAPDRPDHLAALGVAAIELMPVAAFPGQRGWGYDGVLPFAPAAAYGRPDGLMVLLDVIYNHFGPEGTASRSSVPATTPASWAAAAPG